MDQVEDGTRDANSEELRIVGLMQNPGVNLFRFRVYLNRFNTGMVSLISFWPCYRGLHGSGMAISKQFLRPV